MQLQFSRTVARPQPAAAAAPPGAAWLQASAAASNSYHVLQYQYVPDILEKRGPYREAHLAGANKMVGGAGLASSYAATGYSPLPLL